MILGDNIFYGNGFSGMLREAVTNARNGLATIFGYYVNDPERFGIVAFDKHGRVPVSYTHLDVYKRQAGCRC